MMPIKYKTPELEIQMKDICPELHYIINDVAWFSEKIFSKPIIITSLIRPESKTHSTGRAVDIRVVSDGVPYYSTKELLLLHQYLIYKYHIKIDLPPLYHGTAPHLHIGINGGYVGNNKFWEGIIREKNNV